MKIDLFARNSSTYFHPTLLILLSPFVSLGQFLQFLINKHNAMSSVKLMTSIGDFILSLKEDLGFSSTGLCIPEPSKLRVWRDRYVCWSRKWVESDNWVGVENGFLSGMNEMGDM